MERIIGSITGEKKGPLLIVFGGMHGNEPAGIKAIELMLKMIEVEPITNTKFEFKGRFIGIRGNLKALKKGSRYIKRDMNRLWLPETFEKIKNGDKLGPEEQEIKAVWALVQAEIKENKPAKVVIIDLHTTTAFGGIFSIPAQNPSSISIALDLHAPVIKGLLKGIEGTTLHFFTKKNTGVPTAAVCFESGQHDEVLSVNRAIAALTTCLRKIGCVKAEHIENQHDQLILNYSIGLPNISSLIYVHRIKANDRFVMQPGYKNFQKIKPGEVLAKDKNGDILSEHEGLILMPMYQKQGEDGFFIIQKLEGH